MDIFIDESLSGYYKKRPLILVDGGASGGLQSHWKRAEPYLHVIGFEPDKRSFQELSANEGRTYFNAGLYNKRAVMDLYTTKIKTKSSLLKPDLKFISKFSNKQPIRMSVVEVSKIQVDTLDNQLKENGIGEIDFLKLDLQGAELFALEGATKALGGGFGVEVEVEFAPMYENQPLFWQVDSLMRKLNYQLFDLQIYDWKRKIASIYGGPRGQIIYANALYFKDSEAFSKHIENIEDIVLKKSKILRAISICLLYGYLDYALELFHSNTGLFSFNEIELINRKLKCNDNIWIKNKIPKFRGRKRLARLLYKMGDFFSLPGDKIKYNKVNNLLGNLE